MESWHPGAKARVYIAALAVPPALSAWLVCASLFPALWLGEELWAREHTDKHSLHLLNALTREELIAVLEHEAAHHARRDNLLKWALTICWIIFGALALIAAAILTFVLTRRDKPVEVASTPAADAARCQWLR
ncbi:MAG: M48 family metalloprotease [Blastocatellia bacterium]